jgi:hypothetical protein
MAAAVAIVSAHAPRKMFEPLFQNTNRIIATLTRLMVMVIGTRRVIASICLARMRRISRSLRSPDSNRVAAKKPPSQPTNAAGSDPSRAVCFAIAKFPGRSMLREPSVQQQQTL